jgi:hypothetical protein
VLGYCCVSLAGHSEPLVRPRVSDKITSFCVVFAVMFTKTGAVDTIFRTPIPSVLLTRLASDELLQLDTITHSEQDQWVSQVLQATPPLADAPLIPTNAQIRFEELVHTLTLIGELGEFKTMLGSAVEVCLSVLFSRLRF